MEKIPKILVTSGGTRELIDDVRMIANRSTGKLGSLIADVFIARGAEVTYVYANHAFLPNFSPKKSIQIKTVDDLLEQFNTLFSEEEYDAVIHLMAISDFSPYGYCDIDNYKNDEIKPLNDSKISSKLNGMVLFFKNTPKIIDTIRKLQPNTILVGFKLLSKASDEKLETAAKYVMDSSHCDYVIANDQNNISLSKNVHKAFMLDKQNNKKTLNSKEEIAIEIAKRVCKDIKDASK